MVPPCTLLTNAPARSHAGVPAGVIGRRGRGRAVGTSQVGPSPLVQRLGVGAESCPRPPSLAEATDVQPSVPGVVPKAWVGCECLRTFLGWRPHLPGVHGRRAGLRTLCPPQDPPLVPRALGHHGNRCPQEEGENVPGPEGLLGCGDTRCQARPVACQSLSLPVCRVGVLRPPMGTVIQFKEVAASSSPQGLRPSVCWDQKTQFRGPEGSGCASAE